ncbi:tRNA 2-thiocytidine(32) synthetase TtcA [Pseudovibrio exalbescens]|uniref:tRNA 2-thiocytidine(32) synthetase TtcA n=1 Tax=Pseudovibrio exalbescens TaxID=197461 RepID=UPI002365C193|nr:tRNA 2-thiocytidine(32) synthetase TtcA [Pseudovibrio exalbescens]MDD7910470.1 tRNA 2-thiocytidine(32) synthetase TtcA [Pseudovibrio exalbescens]
MDDITQLPPLVETTGPAVDADCHPLFREVPSSVEFKKLRKRLLRETRQVMDDYAMISKDARDKAPRWLVCLSGGKDSYTLLAVLMDLKWRGLLPVDLIACNLDQSQPGFPPHILPAFFERYQIPHIIVREDTYSIVTDKIPENRTYCSLCSRLRRGILYRIAREQGCEAIVLGHHRDDALETFFMNLFHGGRMASMPPKLVNDEGDLMVLRPLMYSSEADIEKFSKVMEFPIIPCNLCGSQDGLQRVEVKKMLQQWEKETPGRLGIMARALAHVRPSHLHDAKLFDFENLRPAEGASTAQAAEAEEPCAASLAMTANLFDLGQK